MASVQTLNLNSKIMLVSQKDRVYFLLRHYASSQKVVGSISDEVIGFFN
jgi:hypothetical protein